MYAIEHEGLTADPGTEVLDLADELAMTAKEARSWLDVEPTEITADLSRLTGHAADYEWATWLANVLRAVGCTVVPYAGWESRGRPRSVGPFQPRGLIWHHDGSPKGPSPSLARFIAEEGRPAEGIPAPLAQLWVCEGCDGLHPMGSWHVLAAGRANHAGEGIGFEHITENMGNTLTLGIETDNTTGEATPPAMLDELVIGSAALLRHMRSSVFDWLAGHKEYAAGRKIDPDDIVMDEARQLVSAEAHRQSDATPKWLRPYPGSSHFVMGHDCGGKKRPSYVEHLESWLLELPMNKRSQHEASSVFTRWTVNAVAAYQSTDPVLRRLFRDGTSGEVDAETWRRLQLRVKAGV